MSRNTGQINPTGFPSIKYMYYIHVIMMINRLWLEYEEKNQFLIISSQSKFRILISHFTSLATLNARSAIVQFKSSNNFHLWGYVQSPSCLVSNSPQLLVAWCLSQRLLIATLMSWKFNITIGRYYRTHTTDIEMKSNGNIAIGGTSEKYMLILSI